jgi:hypothetical protein
MSISIYMSMQISMSTSMFMYTTRPRCMASVHKHVQDRGNVHGHDHGNDHSHDHVHDQIHDQFNFMYMNM